MDAYEQKRDTDELTDDEWTFVCEGEIEVIDFS